MRGRFARLGTADLMNLAVEATDTPMHVGALMVVDGRSLLDPAGELRLADIRRLIEDRLPLVPRLRQVVYRPWPPGGRPLWVDDPSFAVDRHVRRMVVPAPGNETELLGLTARLMASPLDRTRPLWLVWFITGLPNGRVGVLVKVHHAVADGLAAVRLIRTLLDFAPADDAGRQPWTPAARPRWVDLVRENLAGRRAAAVRAVHALTRAAPRRRAAGTVRSGLRSIGRAPKAPRTSLTVAIRPGRRLAVVRLDLDAGKRTAHRYGGKVNDLVLTLAAGGLRDLLRARGEAVDGVRLRASVAASFRTAADEADSGNRSGVVVVDLPLGTADPGERLRQIHAGTVRARRTQVAANEPRFLAVLAALGVLRFVTRRQRLVNVIESSVPGPAEPIHVLGAPVLDLVPIGVLAGNLSIAFLALSYAGRLTIGVWADADRYPDLDVAAAGMRRDWARLAASVPEGVADAR